MRIRTAVLLAVPALALGGCAGELKHEITVSPKLRALPVHAVCLLDPGFPQKVKRNHEDQYPEMAPERRAESTRDLVAAFSAALGASVTIDSACGATEEARAWAAPIAEDLATGRVPLSVKPIPLPVESVLLLGVQSYGTANQQTRVTFLWFKPWMTGDKKYDHRLLVQALLVKPQTGEVLFDALLEGCESAPAPSPDLLDRVVRGVGRSLLEAFFPKP